MNCIHTIDENLTASMNSKQQFETTYKSMDTFLVEENKQTEMTSLSLIIKELLKENKDVSIKKNAEKKRNIEFLLKANKTNMEIIDPLGKDNLILVE